MEQGDADRSGQYGHQNEAMSASLSTVLHSPYERRTVSLHGAEIEDIHVRLGDSEEVRAKIAELSWASVGMDALCDCINVKPLLEKRKCSRIKLAAGSGRTLETLLQRSFF